MAKGIVDPQISERALASCGMAGKLSAIAAGRIFAGMALWSSCSLPMSVSERDRR